MCRPTNNPQITLDQVVLSCVQILTEASKKSDTNTNSVKALFSEKKNL